MKELDEIRARLEAACDYPGSVTIEQSQRDVEPLIAAVDAVTMLADYWQDSAGCESRAHEVFGEQKLSVEFAVAQTRAAIAAALTPIPAAPSGAGEPRGSVVAVEGAGAELGPEIDAWQFREGDLVEWYGEGGIWKVIPSNIYDDKYASIQRERGNRVIMSVPCEELRHVGRKP
ncbi:hypothetical protein [Pseudarthrobacter sp. S6]|uniref:hypothetical protein n=1 Tax=Pseudarthrobacter sp. S6 TaxID=3418420 RepID=UPI003CE73A52